VSAALRARDSPPVVRLSSEQVPLVVRVFSAAFKDYPVMRYVLTGSGKTADTGDGDGDAYPLRLRELVHFFVMARALRDEPLLGIFDGPVLSAAATLSFPLPGPGSPPAGPGSESPAMGTLREKTWGALGAEARSRYRDCTEAWGPLGVEVPHTHLNMIGVLPSHRGKGLARVLLEHVGRISRETPGSQGVTLTTEDPANVPLYQKFGYEITGRAGVGGEFETWGMFRRNEDDDAP